jgi:hypothetical protein
LTQQTKSRRDGEHKAVSSKGHASLQFSILNRTGAGCCDALQPPAPVVQVKLE